VFLLIIVLALVVLVILVVLVVLVQLAAIHFLIPQLWLGVLLEPKVVVRVALDQVLVPVEPGV
jgi:hypothetical protein